MLYLTLNMPKPHAHSLIGRPISVSAHNPDGINILARLGII